MFAAALPAAPLRLRIEYPLEGAVFPPDFAAPTFLWHDESAAVRWSVGFEHEPIHDVSTPSWKPDAAAWERIRQHTAVAITVRGMDGSGRAVSAGSVGIRISRDPVGAPIFYRDVPLMPSEVEKGVIKPLAPAAIPLIAWRLRYVNEPRSRLLLEGLHTCTNCHSFSRDGKTLGMDVDGPENDKGTYAIAPVQPHMTIRDRDIITWNSFRDKPPGHSTIGFLSQISPDGRYAVTTLNEEVYVANFKDYRFLQVFYPTRGILAWYDRRTGGMRPLPGADDPRYVQTDAVWSPDGRYLVFARAQARDAYPPGRKLAEFAGDPNEVPILYDLCRIPFNDGRGGTAEPIAGASANGMSNNFPKISPDGRWIVFVQCRNGQLMRPDSRLFIVPASGGEARRMKCNTSLMNSWHSFSPDGRWLVFSSKSRSPYTQMFLTHIDEDGNDSPPILVENATAPDRAVNIPEFANLPVEGLLSIDVPAAEFYRLFDSALDLERRGHHNEAVSEWKRALAIDPENAKARTNLGIALWGAGSRDEALAEFRKAVALKPGYAQAHNNLGVTLVQLGRYAEAIAEFRAYLGIEPESGQVHHNLGFALLQERRWREAIPEFEKVLAANPGEGGTRLLLGDALYLGGRTEEAVAQWKRAIATETDPAARKEMESRLALGERR